MRLLYVSRTSGVHDRRFVEAWRGSGVEVDSVRISPTDTEGVARLEHGIEAFRPDVVQVGPVTAPGPLVASVWKGPLIVASWAFDVLLEAQESEELERAARAVLARADLLFVDSDAVRDEALRLGADPSGILCFPWGVSPEWLAQPPSPVSTEPFVFLTTRRHEALYRVGDTLTAFIAVADRLPLAELWVAGEGSLTTVLRDLAASSGVGDRIRFVGEQGSVELAALYARAQVYVSSTIVDGTSISLLEAMASGALPIVSDIPGNRQWVPEEVGFRYPTGDVAALAALMLEAALLPDETRASMAVTAFDRVREGADWAGTTAGFAGLLDTVTERSRIRRGQVQHG